jgi:DNA-directed RNA polymerase subunit E'/Rpb7
LEKAFLDRVVPNLGLVVTLHDILSIGDGCVYPSDGGAHYK